MTPRDQLIAMLVEARVADVHEEHPLGFWREVAEDSQRLDDDTIAKLLPNLRRWLDAIQRLDERAITHERNTQ